MKFSSAFGKTWFDVSVVLDEQSQRFDSGLDT